MHSESFRYLSTWIGVHAYRISENLRQDSTQPTGHKNGTSRQSLATANRSTNAFGGAVHSGRSSVDHCVPQNEERKPASFLGSLRRHAVAWQPLRVRCGNPGACLDSAGPVLHENRFRRRPRPGRAGASQPRRGGVAQPGSISPSCVAITAAARREFTPSLVLMFFMWKFTTASEQFRIWEISHVDLPRAVH